jgi:hypothetical protein
VGLICIMNQSYDTVIEVIQERILSWLGQPEAKSSEHSFPNIQYKPSKLIVYVVLPYIIIRSILFLPFV